MPVLYSACGGGKVVDEGMRGWGEGNRRGDEGEGNACFLCGVVGSTHVPARMSTPPHTVTNSVTHD